MYSTCLFCHTTLGANEVVEHFPVGRRLAFDGTNGRLWVVCRKCERWNLTPLEERWEAIEECERAFRETRMRVSTDEIGMARVREGLELVRIGKPLRPEFAAWRYGDQFGRRRRNNVLRTAGIVAGVGAFVALPYAGAAVGISLTGSAWAFRDLARVGYWTYRRQNVAARVTDNDGNLLYVRTKEVIETVMLPPTRGREWGLRVSHRPLPDPSRTWLNRATHSSQTDIRGEVALRAGAKLLPQLNRSGASRAQVQEAVALATKDDNPTLQFEKAARFAKRSWISYGKGAMLTLLPKELSLALEMTAHEDSERRALEGELSLLEDAWREAEEVANISDNMFLPTDVSEKLAEIKSASSQSPH
jgi:hypothetical protein